MGLVPAPLRRLLGAMAEDLDAVLERDPAARSRTDVVLNAPGMHAVWSHRVAHAMWEGHERLRTPARVLSTITRALTGVEIHPGATIGRRCVIDHGMGVVIGETARVGDDALIYHGATLGALDARDGRRHPVLGDRVLVGASACILGPIEVGDDARIGALAVVIRDVPAGGTAVGSAARVTGGTPAVDEASEFEGPSVVRRLR